MFWRVIINLSRSHKGMGQPIMVACSYCGSHATGGHVAPAVTASCLSKESRCGDLLICTAALLTHWDVFDDILPSHLSSPLLLTYILPLATATLSLPHCLSLVHFLTLFPISLLSPSFIHLLVFYHCMQHAILRKPLDISLNTTCAAEWDSWASFVLITISAGIGRALKCNLALLNSFQSLSIGSLGGSLWNTDGINCSYEIQLLWTPRADTSTDCFFVFL